MVALDFHPAPTPPLLLYCAASGLRGAGGSNASFSCNCRSCHWCFFVLFVVFSVSFLVSCSCLLSSPPLLNALGFSPRHSLLCFSCSCSRFLSSPHVFDPWSFPSSGVLFLLACLVHLCLPLAPLLCSCTVRHQVCTVQEGQLLTVTETDAPVIGVFVFVCSSTLLRHHRCSCTAQHQVCVVQEGVQRLLFLQQPLLSSVFLHFCLLFFGVFFLFLVRVSCLLHLGLMLLAFLLALRCVFLVLVLVSCPLHLCLTPGPFPVIWCVVSSRLSCPPMPDPSQCPT